MAKKNSETSVRAPQEGFALLVAPAGVTGAGVAGASYEVGEDGLIEVPADAVASLLEHGFTAAE